MLKKRARYLAVLLVSYLILESVVRLTLFISSFSSVSAMPLDLLRTFGLGLVYDLVAGLFWLIPMALLLLVMPTEWLRKKKGRYPVLLLNFGMNVFAVFTAIALFLFWKEFHTNFNFIAVDYLIYTTEMIGTIWESFNMVLILPAILLAAVILTVVQHRFMPDQFDRKRPLGILLYCVLLACLPALASTVSQDSWRGSVSTNRYNQELAGNGPYGFVHAFFNNELDYDTFYLVQNDRTVMNRLRTLLSAKNVRFANTTDITRHIENRSPLTGKKPNVVLITVESLSSDFCGAFGAQNSFTPHLDELAKRSYIFTNMLATGTRTVRGLEALSISVPPTPGQSILRRPGCEDMDSLAEVFNKEGYNSDFIYGGYGYFDNMNGFFGANGYNVEDRVSLPKEEIFNETIRGVADENLFSQVLKTIDRHYEEGKPAFEMVMTTSNHRPYKFPEKRVNAPQGHREGACRYTDWAINDFLERASKKPWFDNTIFVIVADHQAQAAGKTSLPVNRYRIPCIIYAPKLVQPGQNSRLISQMDLPPTLLGMLGVSYDSRFMGRDIATVPEGQERAFISTYQSLGYVQGKKLVVLEPGKRVDTYQIDNWMTSEYTPVPNDPKLVDDAVTWYQGASYLYRHGLLKRIGYEPAEETGE